MHIHMYSVQYAHRQVHSQSWYSGTFLLRTLMGQHDLFSDLRGELNSDVVQFCTGPYDVQLIHVHVVGTKGS